MKKLLSVLLITLAFGAIDSLLIMLFWNLCLIGAVDGVHELGFLQAWGIAILCSFLFKRNGNKIIDRFSK